MPFSVRNSTAPGPGRIRDFRHRLVGALDVVLDHVRQRHLAPASRGPAGPERGTPALIPPGAVMAARRTKRGRGSGRSLRRDRQSRVVRANPNVAQSTLNSPRQRVIQIAPPIVPGATPEGVIVLGRTNTRWRELLSMAHLFLGDRHQQTSAGPIDGYALLFEMNILFEEYVARLLTRALARTDLTVSAQGGHRDCLFEGETGRFRTRPDLIVRRAAGSPLSSTPNGSA